MGCSLLVLLRVVLDTAVLTAPYAEPRRSPPRISGVESWTSFDRHCQGDLHSGWFEDRLGLVRAVKPKLRAAMVAVSLALQAPDLVRSLVLLSGYYFPTARMDV